jgi:hypothetical protein
VGAMFFHDEVQPAIAIFTTDEKIYTGRLLKRWM